VPSVCIVTTVEAVALSDLSAIGEVVVGAQM
jgi:hypothetical protein